jgi:F-box/leucine-rich repeat protein 2/20
MFNSYAKVDDILLRRMLTFLNVVDLCILCRVCRRWKNMIEKDPLIFENVNLEIVPSHVQVLNLLKIFSRDKHIRSLHLPKNASASDTS